MMKTVPEIRGLARDQDVPARIVLIPAHLLSRGAAVTRER
jgi:hypothetical protein